MTSTWSGRERGASGRRVVAAMVVALLVVILPTVSGRASAATAPPEGGADPAQVLLDRYAPEMVFQTQPEACGVGEPFRPIDPAVLFGRSEVRLRGPDGSVLNGPTPADLPAAGDGDGWFLDLPGDALEPRCAYETFHDSLAVDPLVLGRLATDADHPDRIVLQYWFFYVYNDWNDRHEGDWEMIQVELPASTVEEALDVEPVRTAYAQHEGAELSSWRNGAVRIVDDTHPLVFAGVGSHASYYSSAQWFGASAASGFGCDDTLGPSDRERPAVRRIDADAPPDWLAYTGRWGEKQPSFNNGPTGPVTKTQWDHPVTWMDDEGRVGAVSLPAQGTAVTDFFCSAARAGSVLLFRLIDHPLVVLGVALVALAATVVLVRSTRWRPVELRPVLQARAGGQIIRAAIRLVRRHRRTFLPLGLLMVLAGVVAGAVQLLLVHVTEVGDVVEVVDEDSVWASLLSLGVSFLVVVPITAIVGVATHLAVRALDRGESVTARVLLNDVRDHPRAFVTHIVSTVVLILGLVSIVLVPVAAWLAARWAVIVPAAIDSSHPLSVSSRLTRGRRFRSLALATVAALLVGGVPPLIGTLVLLATGWGFTLVNVVAALVAVVLVPVGSTMIALQYGDLRTPMRASAEV